MQLARPAGAHDEFGIKEGLMTTVLTMTTPSNPRIVGSTQPCPPYVS